MTEDEKFIYNSILSQIRMGFISIEEVKDNIIEEIEDNGLEDEISETWAFKHIENEYNNLKEESKKWDKTSDTQRLIQAFDELCQKNIIALHNAGYTISDGEEEVVEVEKELRKVNIRSEGYCFYHQQDLERAIQTGNLYIAFQKIDNSSEKVAIDVGKKIVKILEKYDFKVEWDENVNERILIKDFEWQWIYKEENRNLLNYEEVIEIMQKKEII